MTTPMDRVCDGPELIGPECSPEAASGIALGSVWAVIPCPLLRAAAERTAAAWRNDLGEAASDSEVRDVLLALARAVYDRRSGRGAASLVFAATPLGRHLLELLRAATLGDLTGSEPTASADVLLTTLRAIEQIRAAIAPQWRDYFASRLSAPDALELLVEVAHDLRSPLTSILCLSETLQSGHSGGINELQRRQLALIYGAALGLSTLAGDVIELARGGGRLVEGEPSPLWVTEILESVRDMVRPMAEEKRLVLRIQPPRTDHRLGHSLPLSRVLLNLTTNALKFTEEGLVELIARETGPSGVEFSVRDTGRGINADALHSLYVAFRRAPRRGGFAFSSTGLGLTMCRRLVEAMGSELQVESRPGWGTRFFFELSLPPATRHSATPRRPAVWQSPARSH